MNKKNKNIIAIFILMVITGSVAAQTEKIATERVSTQYNTLSGWYHAGPKKGKNLQINQKGIYLGLGGGYALDNGPLANLYIGYRLSSAKSSVQKDTARLREERPKPSGHNYFRVEVEAFCGKTLYKEVEYDGAINLRGKLIVDLNRFNASNPWRLKPGFNPYIMLFAGYEGFHAADSTIQHTTVYDQDGATIWEGDIKAPQNFWSNSAEFGIGAGIFLHFGPAWGMKIEYSVGATSPGSQINVTEKITHRVTASFFINKKHPK